MKKPTNSKFAKLAELALADGDEEAPKPSGPTRSPVKRRSVLEKRQNVVQAVASGRMKQVRQLAADPARIKPWAGHNRDYEALSESRCADLIDGFKRAGQQFPAIVRPVIDDPNYDYEFICGARRHWTASFLKLDLLVEVRELDDRDAFILQDIENRDREDISDYERACDYKRALPIFFNGKRKDMAEQLDIDASNFSKLLGLSELPSEIVEAYGDIRELLVHHGVVYTRMLKEPNDGKKLLNAAKRIRGNNYPGKKVLAELKRAVNAPEVSAKSVKKTFGMVGYENKNGKVSLSFDAGQVGTDEGFAKLTSDIESVVRELRGVGSG